MNDIYLIIFVTGVCAYVAAPLFKKHHVAIARDDQTSSLTGELLHQQQMASATIEDLEFDWQTGKLSQEDFDTLVADQRNIQAVADAQLKEMSGLSRAELIAKLEAEIELTKNKKATASVMTCSKCQNPVKPGDKFCAECGTKLAS